MRRGSVEPQPPRTGEDLAEPGPRTGDSASRRPGEPAEVAAQPRRRGEVDGVGHLVQRDPLEHVGGPAAELAASRASMFGPTKSSRGGAPAAEQRELVLAENPPGGESEQRADLHRQHPAGDALRALRRGARRAIPIRAPRPESSSSRIERRLISAHSRRVTHSASGQRLARSRGRCSRGPPPPSACRRRRGRRRRASPPARRRCPPPATRRASSQSTSSLTVRPAAAGVLGGRVLRGPDHLEVLGRAGGGDRVAGVEAERRVGELVADEARSRRPPRGRSAAPPPRRPTGSARAENIPSNRPQAT